MRASALIAALGLLAWTALVLVVAGRPLETDDLWWHLALGQRYAAHGPWLASDPLLRTPHGPLAPASWLFDIALHSVRVTAGFQGLRLLHAGAVLGIAALVVGAARRESRGELAPAALATAIFLAVSWYRLIQLRPELVTIAVALALYTLLLARPVSPSAGRAAAAIALIALNANVHAGFLVGPMLAAAGMLGVLTRAGIESRAGDRAARGASLARARRIGAILAAGLVVALLNPVGLHQHLAPFTAFFEPRLPLVLDEWSSFDPLSLPASATRMSPLAWGIANLSIASIAAALAAAVAVATRRIAWDRASKWSQCDLPVLLLPALASIAGMLLAIRLHWLALFPALFWLRFASCGGSARPALRWGCAIAVVALLCAAPGAGRLRPAALGVPADVKGYLATPYAAEKYHAHAVWFLKDAELSGHLFANYYMGGFLGFWLAPRIQTFVNGTLNFPPERLLDEYEAVARGRSSRSGRHFLDLLDDRGMDLLLGTGLPQQRDPRLPARYTTALLEGAPDWVLAFRNLDSAVYVRSRGGASANLDRVSAYYASRDVPFDRARGFDVARVLRERPDWALAHALAPEDIPTLASESRDGDSGTRLAALDRLGSLQAALGLYADGVVTERQIIERVPRAVGANRRLIFDLLHLDRTGRALRHAEASRRIGIQDPLVAGYARIASRAERGEPVPPLLPLFTGEEAARLRVGFRPPSLRD